MFDLGSANWLVFVGVTSLAMLLLMLASGPSRAVVRLESLADRPDHGPGPDAVAGMAKAALPKVGRVLLPKSEADRTKLQNRLIHAGFYDKQAITVFLGVKLLLIAGPALVGLALGALGLAPPGEAMIVGSLCGAFGIIGPSFWLDRRKAARQSALRRALPDALDVMVICLEGGGSLQSAIYRVSTELRVAHPLLALELTIVYREMQLGRPAGDALRQFAARSDLEEIRGLASVVVQVERFGASLVKSLQAHAEGLRSRRILRAEELAQKAVVKMLFPTILFIMPAIFIVILGPTTVMLMEQFEGIAETR